MSVRGITKTVIWTQFSQAIEKDFGITLPTKAGPTMVNLISAIVDMQQAIVIDGTSTEINDLIYREISKWHEEGDGDWELCDVNHFALVIANQVVQKCIDELILKRDQLTPIDGDINVWKMIYAQDVLADVISNIRERFGAEV